MNLELKKAIDQICKDRGLDRNMLIETLQEAVRTSVLRRYSEDIDVEVTYNEETGDIEVYQFKIVVPDDDVANEDTQIAISDAKKHDPSVQLDDEVGFRVNIEDLGRIAAQSAKQVIIQRMRDAEQAQIFDEFKDRIGEIVSGTVQRLGHFPRPHRGHPAPRGADRQGALQARRSDSGHHHRRTQGRPRPAGRGVPLPPRLPRRPLPPRGA